MPLNEGSEENLAEITAIRDKIDVAINDSFQNYVPVFSALNGEDSEIDRAVHDMMKDMKVEKEKVKTLRERPKSRLLGFGSKTLKGEKPNHHHNQDALLIRERLMYEDYLHLFAVIDGHGGNGHECANYVKNNLAAYLREFAIEKLKMMFGVIDKDTYEFKK